AAPSSYRRLRDERPVGAFVDAARDGAEPPPTSPPTSPFARPGAASLGGAPSVRSAPLPVQGPPAAPASVGRTRRRRRTLSAVWVVPLVVLSLAAGFLGGLLGDRVLPDDGRRTDAGLP